MTFCRGVLKFLLGGLFSVGLISQTEAQLKFFDCSKQQSDDRPGLNRPGQTPGRLAVSQQAFDDTRQFLFRSGFELPGFSGSLRKHAVIAGDAGDLSVDPVAQWEAADQWTADAGNSPSAASTRNIVTLDERSGRTIPFAWPELSSRQKEWMDQSPSTGDPDGLGQRRVAYLRGDRSDETGHPNGVFRPRKTIFGAILNSTPVLHQASPVTGIGVPVGTELRRASFETVFVGANDGMLHAFSLADGKELFAYIPGFLLRSLAQSTVPERPPQPGFDGKLVVRDVDFHGHLKSILVGAAGSGSKGVVALDVSAPADFGHGDQGGALWEFSDADDPDMGAVIAEPVIGRFHVSPNQARFFAVVATGQLSVGGPGRLFLLALDKAPGTRWVLNVNYFKLATPAVDGPGGLAPPALVIGDGGLVRFAYSGDLAGNLWRFDFSGPAPWGRARKLFSAHGQNGKPQPVVAQPRVVFAPGGGYLILFGTGRLLTTEDGLPSGYGTQSFYAIRDPATPDVRTVRRAELAARTIRISAAGAATITGAPVDYRAGNAAHKGWYVDFPDAHRTGERQVAAAIVLSGQLAFRSLLPAADGCDRGDGRTYLLGALTGLPESAAEKAAAPATATTVASADSRSTLQEQPYPLVVSYRDGMSLRNAMGGAVISRKIIVPASTPAGQAGAANEAQSATAQLPAGRLSWREVANWREAYRASRQD